MTKMKKITMIKVGEHIIDPTDIACVSKIKDRNLYVVRLKSQPNMEYPIWAKKSEVSILFEQFNIIVSDDVNEDTD